MISVNIKVTDTADPMLVAKLAQCDPHTVATRITPPLAGHWRDTLRGLPRNKMGFPSTMFWETAARSVHGVAVGGLSIISADKLGLAQRLYGGTIKARNVKNLTIPICAEAYGTTVADWGYDNLIPVYFSNGNKFLALWLGYEAARDAYAKNLSKLTKYAGTTAAKVGRLRASLPGDRKKPDYLYFKSTGSGVAASRPEGQANFKLLFLLKESVEQMANPAVLPQDLQEFALEEVRKATA